MALYHAHNNGTVPPFDPDRDSDFGLVAITNTNYGFARHMHNRVIDEICGGFMGLLMDALVRASQVHELPRNQRADVHKPQSGGVHAQFLVSQRGGFIGLVVYEFFDNSHLLVSTFACVDDFHEQSSALLRTIYHLIGNTTVHTVSVYAGPAGSRPDIVEMLHGAGFTMTMHGKHAYGAVSTRGRISAVTTPVDTGVDTSHTGQQCGHG